ncbi:MAG: BlaI/MecI/CopY family transcriptional regulator [Streptococcaceae bacterium]|jgi:predicted transcriptional regulator|nr:BlaI/MecI/CopY family transcriptional regulator [Streptococcaceae bacterium]
MDLQLTKKEQKIMDILWNAEKPMSANDINQEHPEVNKNTVQAVLKKLMNRELIIVADIGYSGTVLTRLYQPNISQEDYIAQLLSEAKLKNLLIKFIESCSQLSDLEQLEIAIAQKKRELNE